MKLLSNYLFLKLFLTLFLLNFENVSAYMVGNNPHHRKEMLDTKGKYQLEWIVDWSAKRVNFTVTVETLGAIGFGLSSNGKMTGADIVIGGVFSGGRSYFQDFHAVGNQMPEVDPSQDWILHSASEGTDHTILRFSRAFDTCDPQDYPITEDRISIIWSYTETDSPIKYHRGNRGEYNVYLLHPDYSPPIVLDQNVGISNAIDQVDTSLYNHLKKWRINTRMVIPAEDTTYWCTIHKSPNLPRKHHHIGFEVVFPNEQSRPHIHHLLLHRCRVPPGSRTDSNEMFGRFVRNAGQRCLQAKNPVGPMPTEFCTDFYQGWAVGGRPYFNPPHMGLALGEDKDEYYMLQVHYNNPEKLANVLVEFSLDMYYTSQLRENEGGIMVVRHESPGLTPSLVVPPMSLDHQVYGLCGSECTQEMLPRKGIRINGLILHSHNTGKQMRFQHFRGNRELPWIESDDNYDFNYQQMRNLNKEVNVLPGDMLVLKCTYDNTMLNGTTTVGGFSSQQEMCAAFFYYYGKVKDFVQCASEIEDEYGRQRFLGIGNVTWSPEELEFIVDSPSALAGLRVSQVSDNFVNWDERQREEFQRYILRKPHVNKCPREMYSIPRFGSEGEDFRRLLSGRSENEVHEEARSVEYPYEAKPFMPEKSCSFV